MIKSVRLASKYIILTFFSLGTGEFRIKNLEEPNLVLDIGYFYALKERLQIIYPLQFTKVSFILLNTGN